MLKRFSIFLGTTRLQILFILFGATGFISLALNAVDEEWVPAVQSLMVLIFLVGAGLVIGSRLESYERGRWLAILVPAFGLVFLGVIALPQLQVLFLGGAMGWIIAAMFLFRTRGAMEYKNAIKHLRRDEYSDAVSEMDSLIKQQPDVLNHYRFRAEILRLWGKLDRARRDYETMIKIDPESALGYNGLAEVDLQSKRYSTAHESALKAFELAPDEWVAAYNLGMIEDRLGDSQATVDHLTHALNMKVRDARHRLLIHLYFIRAYQRLNKPDLAQEHLLQLKKNESGLSEWQTILQSPQAGTLRAVIAEDIGLIEQLIIEQSAIDDVIPA